MERVSGLSTLPIRPFRAAILLLACLVLASGPPVQAAPVVHVVHIRGVPFELEVAADRRTRTLGLSGRTGIPSRGGMLFVFPDEIPRSFWMRDCVVDMGLVFLDRHGRVVRVYEMQVEPPRRPGEEERAYLARLRLYPSMGPAKYAIELRSGVADAFGLARGELIDLSRAPPAVN